MILMDNINGKIVTAEVQPNGFIFFPSNELPIQERYIAELDNNFDFYSTGLLYDLRNIEEKDYQYHIDNTRGMIQVEEIGLYKAIYAGSIYTFPTECELDYAIEDFAKEGKLLQVLD